MANPKLMAVDLSVPTYTWSGGADSSYPVSNLKNYFSDIYSKSDVLTADCYLQIDMQSAVTVNRVIVDGTNFASVAVDVGIKFQYNTNDDTNWADAVTVDDFAASNSAQQMSVNSISKRYWRVFFSSTVPLAVKPYIGNIFIGTTLDFEFTQQWGFHTNMPDFTDVTSESRALDGRIRSAQTAGPIRKHKINFDDKNAQSDALITSFLAFLATAKQFPFYYIDNNSVIYCVKWSRGFNPYEAYRYNQNKIPDLQMESILAG